MELIGGNEIKLPSLKRENISYVFPNKVSQFTSDKCQFVVGGIFGYK